MLETGTENANLIEINPRSTQVGHLSLGPGRDLPAALYAVLSEKAEQAAPKVTEKDTIALFPQEWIRDPQSAFLKSAFHDVPWERTRIDSRLRQQPPQAERLVSRAPRENRSLRRLRRPESPPPPPSRPARAESGNR